MRAMLREKASISTAGCCPSVPAEAAGGGSRRGAARGASATLGVAGWVSARPLPSFPAFLFRAFFGFAAAGSPASGEGLNLCIVSSTRPGFDIFGRYPWEIAWGAVGESIVSQYG